MFSYANRVVDTTLTQKHSVSEAFLNSGVSAILLRNFSCKTSSRGGLPYAAMLPCHTVESTPVKQAMIMATDITLFISLNGRIRQSHLPSNLTLKIPSGETAGSDMQIDEILPTDPERPLNDAPCAITDPTTSPNLTGDFPTPNPSQGARLPSLDTVEIGSGGLVTIVAPISTSWSLFYVGQQTNLRRSQMNSRYAAFSHSCFIMSWMGELLPFYNERKISFMS
ncbi:hypothetical protein MJO28_010442 [Puccinia striiformis f. sp. tritici]|uniref:Uncharacterized protein n=1 Tax=Puccinia striiformis f. sp. tritici TaxID=168172 RepID=A0ACC0E520_9BASI|nr:hypothetical protein MJO28_010442 [Puccinia striiformis f. sp. tritici]